MLRDEYNMEKFMEKDPFTDNKVIKLSSFINSFFSTVNTTNFNKIEDSSIKEFKDVYNFLTDLYVATIKGYFDINFDESLQKEFLDSNIILFNHLDNNYENHFGEVKRLIEIRNYLMRYDYLLDDKLHFSRYEDNSKMESLYNNSIDVAIFFIKESKDRIKKDLKLYYNLSVGSEFEKDFDKQLINVKIENFKIGGKNNIFQYGLFNDKSKLRYSKKLLNILRNDNIITLNIDGYSKEILKKLTIAIYIGLFYSIFTYIATKDKNKSRVISYLENYIKYIPKFLPFDTRGEIKKKTKQQIEYFKNTTATDTRLYIIKVIYAYLVIFEGRGGGVEFLIKRVFELKNKEDIKRKIDIFVNLDLKIIQTNIEHIIKELLQSRIEK